MISDRIASIKASFMKLNVLFFGATAEVVGQRVVRIDVEPGSTSGKLFEHLLDSHSELKSHKLLFALNEEYASGNETLSEGDELAIFTAVSGG